MSEEGDWFEISPVWVKVTGPIDFETGLPTWEYWTITQ